MFLVILLMFFLPDCVKAEQVFDPPYHELAKVNLEMRDFSAMSASPFISPRELKKIIDGIAVKRNGLLCSALLQEKDPGPIPLVQIKDVPGLRITKDLLSELGISDESPEIAKLLPVLQERAERERRRQQGSRDEHTDNTTYSEILSSIKYASKIHSVKRESVVLVPRYGFQNVPGFDGVIFDYLKRPVANYSLKKGPTEKIEFLIDMAVERAATFSQLPSWLGWIEDGLVFDSRGKSKVELAGRYQEVIRLLKPLLKLFGIPVEPYLRGEPVDARPCRIVIDVVDPYHFLQLPNTFLDGVRERVRASKGSLDSITFLVGSMYFEVRSDGTQTGEFSSPALKGHEVLR